MLSIHWNRMFGPRMDHSLVLRISGSPSLETTEGVLDDSSTGELRPWIPSSAVTLRTPAKNRFWSLLIRIAEAKLVYYRSVERADIVSRGPASSG